ncbi:MAG: coat protein [Cressdnaviricota sp.]|nr:MAG: coat protein [Cressdnaviricota sp.]
MFTIGKPPVKKQQVQKRKRPTQFSNVPQIYRRGPRMEIKYVDNAATDDNFNLVGGTPWILVNGIVQGAGNNQRIGNKVSLKALRMKGQIINLATAVQTYGRLLVIYDKQPNGALPTYAAVMQTRDSAGAATNTAFSDPNFDNKERFTILRDTTIVFPSVTNTVGVLTNVGFDQQSKSDINIFNVDMYIKLKGLHTAYTGATAGIADISTGSLLFAVMIHQGAATWTFRNVERLTYYDN